ncbi:MAG: hypothetical protein J7539_01970 [Niabella sp.]|nr:hypothetical protein [Niabella sp.]
MCNCGQKRQQFHQEISQPGTLRVNAIPKNMWEPVAFEYMGKTSLVVTGGITGKRYYFSHPNQVQKIDYRDAPGMMAVPLLKKVMPAKEPLH